MRADLTIQCSGAADRIYWQMYAGFFILIYPVFVPMAIFLVLFYSRQEINVKLERLDDGETVEVNGVKHVIYSFAALQHKDDKIRERLFDKYDTDGSKSLEREEMARFIEHSLLRIGEKVKLMKAAVDGQPGRSISEEEDYIEVRITEFNFDSTFRVKSLDDDFDEDELDVNPNKVPKDRLKRLARINDDALDEVMALEGDVVTKEHMYDALNAYEKAEKTRIVNSNSQKSLRHPGDLGAQDSSKSVQPFETMNENLNELKEQLVLALASKICHFRKYRWCVAKVSTYQRRFSALTPSRVAFAQVVRRRTACDSLAPNVRAHLHPERGQPGRFGCGSVPRERLHPARAAPVPRRERRSRFDREHVVRLHLDARATLPSNGGPKRSAASSRRSHVRRGHLHAPSDGAADPAPDHAGPGRRRPLSGSSATRRGQRRGSKRAAQPAAPGEHATGPRLRH